MKILLTAFDPFGSDTINPALEVMKLIPADFNGIELVKVEIPTVFGLSIDIVSRHILKEKPDAVLALGQAGGRSGITVERVAININDAGIQDNAAYMPVDEIILADGPAAYFSTLPIKEIVAAIKKEGLPADISNSAGTFVCNQLMYGILHTIQMEELDTMGGFIHVPYIPQQVVNRGNLASMSLTDISRGIELAIQVIAHKLRETKMI